MPQDKVNLHPQERLDLPDAQALQSLVYQGMNQIIGGLMGPISGALTPVVWTKALTGATYTLSLDKVAVAHFNQTASRTEDRGFSPAVNVGTAWDALAYSFDPGDAGHQNHPIDYTAARSAEQASPGTRPYLWVRPVEVDSDVDVRRVWSVATGASAPSNLSTRVRQRLEFGIGETAPLTLGGAQWCAFAQVTAWNGADDTIQEIRGVSAWDDSDVAALLQDPGDPVDPDSASSTFAHPLARLAEGSDIRGDGSVSSYPPGLQRSGGLVYHLAWIRSRLQALLSRGSADPGTTTQKAWWKLPVLSLEALKDYVLDLVLDNSRQKAIASGVIGAYPSGLYAAPYDVEGWDLRHGWGFEEVVDHGSGEITLRLKDNVASSKADWYISSVQVTPIYCAEHISTGNRLWRLLPKLLPVPDVSPSDWASISPLKVSAYEGGSVRLPAGQYGVEMAHVRLFGNGASPSLLEQTVNDSDMNSYVFYAVTVYASRYKGSDAGV